MKYSGRGSVCPPHEDALWSKQIYTISTGEPVLHRWTEPVDNATGKRGALGDRRKPSLQAPLVVHGLWRFKKRRRGVIFERHCSAGSLAPPSTFLDPSR